MTDDGLVQACLPVEYNEVLGDVLSKYSNLIDVSSTKDEDRRKILGLMMRETGGKANPVLCMQAIVNFQNLRFKR